MRVDQLIRKNSPAPKETKIIKKKAEPKPKPAEVERQKRQSQAENAHKYPKLPDSWNRYTTRAFQKCKTNTNDIEIMGKLLTEEHDKAIRNKQMGRNWDEYPLPVLPSETAKTTTVFPRERVAGLHQARIRRPGVRPRVFQQGEPEVRQEEQPERKPAPESGQAEQRAAASAEKKPETRTRQVRACRYSLFYKPDDTDDDRLIEKLKIEGTCQELEKRYYRLTEVPDASKVRPQPVLERALAHILKKFQNGQCEAHFVVDQFRSIRLVLDDEPGHEDPANPQRVHRQGLRVQLSLLSRAWCHRPVQSVLASALPALSR